MLRLTAIGFAALMLFSSTGCVLQPALQPATTELVSGAALDARLDARLDAMLAPLFKPDAPGAAIIVMRGGKPLLRKAYGMADTSKGIAMTPDMTLRLGSITKQFTAAAILLLAEDGKLALTDDITTHLPGYPTRGKRITIEHLLTHTSGIPGYTGKRNFGDIMAQDMTVAQMIDFFKDDPLDFEPGTRYTYSNSGYFLLGAIIEKVSGQSYAAFLAERIFVPLGMTRTSYEGHERVPGPRAAGHSRSAFGFGPSRAISMHVPHAAGALVSSVDDLARWDAALASGKLLKPASLRRAQTPFILANGKPTSYGYGWHVGSLHGTALVDHGGNINGFASFALRLPEHDLYVAVLTNADSGIVAADTVAYQTAALVIGKSFPAYRAIKLDPALLDAYAGTYVSDEQVRRTFRRENGQLVMQGAGRQTVLTPYSETGFFAEGTVNHVEFARAADGRVAQATFYRPTSPMCCFAARHD